jgi:hypothetical protein
MEQKLDPIKLAEELRGKHSKKLAEKLAVLKKPEPKIIGKKVKKTEKDAELKSKIFTQKDADQHEFEPETIGHTNKYKDRYVPDDAKDEESKIAGRGGNKIGTGSSEFKKTGTEPVLSDEEIALLNKVNKGEKDNLEEAEVAKDAEQIPARGEASLAPEQPEREEVNLEKMKQEVEEARINFARKDYEVTTAMDRLRGFFGKNLTTDSRKIPDTEEVYKQYKNKTDALLEFQLENIKNRLEGANNEIEKMEIDKEIKDLILHFHKDEKINLFEARTNARAEAKKDKLGERFFQESAKVINWWRKLPIKYKIMISAGIFVGGGGLAVPAVMAGFSTASLGVLGTSIFAKSAAGTAFLGAYRAFSGIATGTGIGLGLETRYRRKENKKSEEFAEKLMDESEISTDKFQNIMDKLKGIDYRDSLKIEQDKSLKRLAIGAAAAGIIGSGALSWGMKKFFGWIGLGTGTGSGMKPHDIDTKKTAEWLGKDMNESDKYINDLHNPATTGIPGTPKNILEINNGEGADLASPNPPPPGADEVMGTNVPEEDIKNLLVEKGSSLEKTLINHFRGMGISAEEAGKKAHLMAREYVGSLNDPNIHEGNLIHPGAEIKLDPIGNKIIGIEDSQKFGDLPAKNPVSETVYRDIGNTNVNTPPAHIEEVGSGKIGNATPASIEEINKEFSAVETDPAKRAGIIGKLGNAQEEINRWSEQPASKWEAGVYQNHLGSLIKNRDEVLNMLNAEESFVGKVKLVVGEIRKGFSLGNINNWRSIRGLTVENAQSSSSGETKTRITGFLNEAIRAFGNKAQPLRGETLERWTNRMAKAIVESKK